MNLLIQIETKSGQAIVVDAELFRAEKGWTETPVVETPVSAGVIVSKIVCSETNYNDAFAWADENECHYPFNAVNQLERL